MLRHSSFQVHQGERFSSILLTFVLLLQNLSIHVTEQLEVD